MGELSELFGGLSYLNRLESVCFKTRLFFNKPDICKDVDVFQHVLLCGCSAFVPGFFMKIMDKHYHSHTENGSSDVSSAPILLVDATLMVSNTISYFFAVPR